MFARIISILSVVLVFSLPVWAAPAISGVSGTMSNGESITISGSDFGSTGPTVDFFDDFSSGTSGDLYSQTAKNAVIGTWRAFSAQSPLFPKLSNAYAHSGTLSMMHDWSDNGADDGHRKAVANMSTCTTFYLSFWTYVPTNRDIPGTNVPALANWKFFHNSYWVGDTWYVQSDATFVLMSNDLPITAGTYFMPLQMGWYDTNSPAFCTVNGDFGEGYGPTNMTKGKWHRWEIYIKGDSSNGTLSHWEMDSSNARRTVSSVTGCNTLHSGEHWNVIELPGYARGDSNSQTYMDDVYIATGDAALARVEIGNNATYTSCTNLAVCTPTSWADTSITATVRSGSFTSGTAYLFVTDASGVTSAGKEITFGSSPSSPTIRNGGIR